MREAKAGIKDSKIDTQRGMSVVNAAVGASIAGIKGVFDDIVYSNTKTETALGITMLACIYLMAWTDALNEATIAAKDSSDGFTAMSVLWTLTVAMGRMWLLLFILAVVTIILDKVVISTLFKSLTPNLVDSVTERSGLFSITVGMRVAFAWCLNLRVLTVIVVSLVMTYLFSSVYITYSKLHRADRTRQQRALIVRNAFLFNATVLTTMVVGQLWVDSWWDYTGGK